MSSVVHNHTIGVSGFQHISEKSECKLLIWQSECRQFHTTGASNSSKWHQIRKPLWAMIHHDINNNVMITIAWKWNFTKCSFDPPILFKFQISTTGISLSSPFGRSGCKTHFNSNLLEFPLNIHFFLIQSNKYDYSSSTLLLLLFDSSKFLSLIWQRRQTYESSEMTNAPISSHLKIWCHCWLCM